MKTNMTYEHYLALKEAVYPLKFAKNSEGIRKMMMVRDVLDFIKEKVAKSDVEIAMEEQGIVETKIMNLYLQPSSLLLKTWTPKGFIDVGTADIDTIHDYIPEDSVVFCNCTYPEKDGIACKKCKKLML